MPLYWVHSTFIRAGALPSVSVAEFRDTARVIRDELAGCGEEIYLYWSNQSQDVAQFDREESLHIRKSADGSFYLEIGNILHRGPLAELEEVLYQWAQDEGWLH